MKKTWLVIFYSVISLIVFAAAIILSGNALSVTDLHLYIAGWALVLSYVLLFVVYTKINGSVVCVFNIFLGYSFLSNCGQTFLNLLGYTDHIYVDVYASFSQSDIYASLLFQLSCISLLGIGGVWANYLSTQKNVCLQINTEKATEKKHATIIFLHYLFSAVVLVQLLTRAWLRMESSYSDAYEEFTGFFSVLWVIYAILFSAVCLFENNTHRKFATFIAIILCVLCFVLGTRTYAIAIMGILVFNYSLKLRKGTKGSKLKFKQKIGIVLLALFLSGCINLTTELRELALSQITFQMVVEQFNPFSTMGTVISEMGTSAATIIKTMKTIPDIGYQNTIGYNVVEMFVPHFIMNIFGMKEPMVLQIGVGDWVTFHTGALLAGKSGMGFSYIAEAFLNYGYWGCLFTFVHGFMIAWLEKRSVGKALNGYILYPALAVFYISRQIFYARAQLDLMVDPVRYLVLIAISAWIIKQLKNAKRNH